jgi:hypothetical protein
MDDTRLEKIKEMVEHRDNQAQRILEGDADNYDGADGARYIKDLCRYCWELIAEIEKK